jgi:hypothetical protein
LLLRRRPPSRQAPPGARSSWRVIRAGRRGEDVGLVGWLVQLLSVEDRAVFSALVVVSFQTALMWV